MHIKEKTSVDNNFSARYLKIFKNKGWKNPEFVGRISDVKFFVEKMWKCLAIRKISCNFATLLGANCRHVIANSLKISGVGGECMCASKSNSTKKLLIIIQINQKKLRCLLFSN